MKIMIASDSYKGSLTSLQVANCIKKGIKEVFPDSQQIILSMADGGEGTTEAVVESLNGQYRTIRCYDPLYQEIEARYGLFDQDKAIIEMASASGLPLIKEKKIRKANTFGTGQLILDALNQGCHTIYIGIGGSATNDGGIGMAHALGIRFYDHNHNELLPVPENLPAIAYIDSKNLDQRIKNTAIIVMCDVSNPLCGTNGATHVYGPQKGASIEDIKYLDQGLQHLADICVKQGYSNFQNEQGAGAAGGLGFGLMTFLNARLQSGINTVLEIVRFDEQVNDCQLVITGEGKIDNQSLNGKVPIGVALAAKKYHIPTVAIVGSIGQDATKVFDYIESIESCVPRPCHLHEALDNAKDNLYQATLRIMKAIRVGMNIKK